MPVERVPGGASDDEWEFDAPKWFDFTREETAEEAALQEAFFDPPAASPAPLAAELQAEADAQESASQFHAAPHDDSLTRAVPGPAHNNMHTLKPTQTAQPKRITSAHAKHLERARSLGKRKREVAEAAANPSSTALTATGQAAHYTLQTPRSGATLTRQAAAAAAAASAANAKTTATARSDYQQTLAQYRHAASRVVSSSKRRKMTSSDDEGRQYPEDAIARLQRTSTPRQDGRPTSSGQQSRPSDLKNNPNAAETTRCAHTKGRRHQDDGNVQSQPLQELQNKKRKASEVPPALSTGKRAKRMSQQMETFNAATSGTTSGPPSLNTRQRSKRDAAMQGTSCWRASKLETVQEAPKATARPPRLNTSSRARSNAKQQKENDGATRQRVASSGVLTRSQKINRSHTTGRQEDKLYHLEEEHALHRSRRKRLSSLEPFELQTEARWSKRQRTSEQMHHETPATSVDARKVNEDRALANSVQFKAGRVQRSNRQPFAPTKQNVEAGLHAEHGMTPTLNTSKRASSRGLHEMQQKMKEVQALEAEWQRSKRDSSGNATARRSMRVSMLQQRRHSELAYNGHDMEHKRKRNSNAV